MNMEIPPKNESSEKIEKQKVLDMLRMNGFGHPETKELVVEWTKQKEAEVEQSENPNRESIIFNIERTDLYIAVGDKEGAIECLEDALTQADQENEVELQNQILEKLKSLE
jgi:translation elongation factor EF-1beta